MTNLAIEVSYNLQQTENDIINFILGGKTEYLYSKDTLSAVCNYLNMIKVNYQIVEVDDDGFKYYEIELV